MIPFIGAALGPLFDVVNTVLDRALPDKTAREAAALQIAKLAQDGEFRDLETRMSAIVAEAKSADPWTSRARPMYFYIFYLVIVVLVVVGPIVGVFYPAQMTSFFGNVKTGFEAIPGEAWAVFVSGYLGYSGLRTVEKVKGVTK